MHCAFEGDAWPLMDESDFYVLVSKPFSTEEKAKFCGPNRTCTSDEADTYLTQLKDAGALYWIFAVKRPQQAKPPPSVKRTKKKTTAK